jgi:hypothetical protein
MANLTPELEKERQEFAKLPKMQVWIFLKPFLN